MVQQVFAHLLCHSLGQGGHQYTFLSVDARLYFIHKVVYLVLRGSYLYFRVQQSCRTNQLFHHDTFRLLQFEVGRSGRYVYHLMRHLLELLKAQGPVVKGGRQSEPVFHQIGLSGSVTSVHRPNLRHTHMTLVYHHQIVVGEEVQQTVRSFSCLSAVKVARIVLNARAVAQFLDHLHVIFHAFLDALRLDGVAHFLEESHLFHQVILNVPDGDVRLFLGGHKQVGGV